MTQRDVTLESQTNRARLDMRDRPVRCPLRPGERLREIPLVRLKLSRTPPQLVLDRLDEWDTSV